MTSKKSSGFTLIEVMIVVAIVAILSVFALASYQRYATRGAISNAVQQLTEIQGQVERQFAQGRGYAAVQYNKKNLVGQSIPVYYSKAKVFNITYAVNKDNVFQYTLTATAADDNQKERLGDCHTLTLDQAGQKGPKEAVSKKCW